MRWSLLLVLACVVVYAWPRDHARPAALPPLACTERCDQLVWFAPSSGPGYVDLPLDGETATPESTSYLRRDLMMAIKYAAAKVARIAGGHPLVLGDASDRNGDTPGTLHGQPRHPRNTHADGLDIDLGYYQRNTPNNNLRAICRHDLDGVDQYHCTGAPFLLDARRTALFLGFLFESPHVRVVGVDGRAARPIQRAIERACTAGTIEVAACTRIVLAFETQDTGRNWFLGHHGHMHVSWKPE